MLLPKRFHPMFGPDDTPPGGPPPEPPAEPPGTPPPAPAEFKPEEWKGLLPEDMRENPAIRDLATPEAAVKSLIEAQGMIGNSVRIPTEDASDEDRQAFTTQILEKVPGLMLKPDMADDEARDNIYMALGRPEKGEDYTIPEVDSQGIELDHAATEAFRPLAHKAGLNQKQFDLIVGEMTKGNIAAAIQSQKAHDADLLELSKEWGVEYEPRIKAITNFARQSRAPEDLVASLEANAISGATLKWLHDLSTSIPSEGGGVNRDQPGAGDMMTATEAKQRINEIMANTKHAFWIADDPGHKEALEYMVKLRKLADPSASQTIDSLRASR